MSLERVAALVFLVVVLLSVGFLVGAYSANRGIAGMIRARDPNALTVLKIVGEALGFVPVYVHPPEPPAFLPRPPGLETPPGERCDLCGERPGCHELYARNPIASSRFGPVRGSLLVCVECRLEHLSELEAPPPPS